MSEREAIRLLAAKLKFDAKIAAAEFQERIRLAEMTFGPLSPPPPPEKSPLDKALEDFVAKRKEKRDRDYYDQDAMDRLIAQDAKDAETERNLDRAMRRLSFHEQDIHTRLMPYRREE